MVQKRYNSHIIDTTNIRIKFLSINVCKLCQYSITLTAETRSQLDNISQNDHTKTWYTLHNKKPHSKPPLLFHKLFNTAST